MGKVNHVVRHRQSQSKAASFGCQDHDATARPEAPPLHSKTAAWRVRIPVAFDQDDEGHGI